MGIEPTYSAWKADVLPLNYTRRCPVPESNQRHEDFQSSALPTELTGLVVSQQQVDFIENPPACQELFRYLTGVKSQAINAKLYLRNIISSFCTTLFAFCWQICTDCPSFRFALCLFYSFYASLASSSWNSSPEVFHPNISLG